MVFYCWYSDESLMLMSMKGSSGSHNTRRYVGTKSVYASLRKNRAIKTDRRSQTDSSHKPWFPWPRMRESAFCTCEEANLQPEETREEADSAGGHPHCIQSLAFLPLALCFIEVCKSILLFLGVTAARYLCGSMQKARQCCKTVKRVPKVLQRNDL